MAVMVLCFWTIVIEADMKITIPSHLSDKELFAEAKRLAGREREATAHLVAHLAEIEARRLYLGAGFRSLFAYCREVLELSEQSAYNRIEAAHAARKFPVILEMLSEAALTLATVRLVAPHLTVDNYDQLLKDASRKSKREVEELLARRFPQPAVADSVRKVAVRAPVEDSGRKLPEPTEAMGACATSTNNSRSTCPGASRDHGPVAADAETGGGAATVRIPASPARGAVRPLAEDRYEIRFTARASTCEKLRLAQDLMRHAVPDGEIAELIDRALIALLEDIARKKFGATEHPRTGAAPGPASRHIPAAVRRTVWLRDGGRCCFMGSNGRRCDARGFLEFHHVEPVAAGGPPTSENIQLRCRAHNSYEAQLYFDPASLHDGGTCPGAS